LALRFGVRACRRKSFFAVMETLLGAGTFRLTTD